MNPYGCISADAVLRPDPAVGSRVVHHAAGLSTRSGEALPSH